MSTINPAAHLYDEMLTILRSIVIKYQSKSEEYETFSTRSYSETYMNACLKKDTFFSYNDYSREEYIAVGVTYEGDIIDYINNPDIVPISVQQKVLENRRKYIIDNYVEQNEYYRMLNGLPPLDDKEKDFVYIPKEYCNMYSIPPHLPIHCIEDELGPFYINVLEGAGCIDQLIKEYPEKKYLKYLGSKRINIITARRAKNFSILYMDTKELRESIHREFVRMYERSRDYFVTVCYIHEYSSIIEYYDNFIAMCIFLMTMQQVSVRMISNATDREYYDDYAIQLLYETYGVPFNKKIDTESQKQIVQNVNLLIQNKACDKVLIDISEILGFQSINIFEYYLVKERLFDSNGRPIFLWTTKWDEQTGKYINVPDYENMYDLHFQRALINEDNLHKALQDPDNRTEYLDLTLNDPFWWEDDPLYHSIWEEEFNYIETKYLGVTIPYRMTEMLFQSIIQFQMIFDKSEELFDLTVQIPKITTKEVSLPVVIVLLCSLMCKKYHLNGYITYAPSQIIHILEILDREIHHEIDSDIEVLKFDFGAFDPEIISSFRELRIKEECKKLTDEEIQELYDHNQFSIPCTEYIEEKELKKEMIQLIAYGIDKINGINDQIDETEKDKFIEGKITKLHIGKYISDFYNRIKYILNAKLEEGNYNKYFSIDFEKSWVDDPNIEIGNGTFDVYLRVKNNLERTREIVEKYLLDKSYQISFIDDVEGGHYHDIDLLPDGTQNLASFKKLRNVIYDTKAIDEFYDHLVVLSAKTLGVTKEQKVESLNKLYENVKELYNFISYRMMITTDFNEYYALKKLYDTAFYAKETANAFKIKDEDGNIFEPETFFEYLKYKDPELYQFIMELDPDKSSSYIDHIIYRLEKILKHVDNLYIMNDEVTPLQELLVQLIIFFKSYTTDMTKLSSYMIIDFRMENMLKFFDHPQYLAKTLLIKDPMNMTYSDFLHRFTVRFTIESLFKMYEDIAIGANSTASEYISSNIFLDDEKDVFYVNAITIYRVIDVNVTGETISEGFFLENGEYYDSHCRRIPHYDIMPEYLEHLILLRNKVEKTKLTINTEERREAFWRGIKEYAEKRHQFSMKKIQCNDSNTMIDFHKNSNENLLINDSLTLNDEVFIKILE